MNNVDNGASRASSVLGWGPEVHHGGVVGEDHPAIRETGGVIAVG